MSVSANCTTHKQQSQLQRKQLCAARLSAAHTHLVCCGYQVLSIVVSGEVCVAHLSKILRLIAQQEQNAILSGVQWVSTCAMRLGCGTNLSCQHRLQHYTSRTIDSTSAILLF